MTRVSFGLRRIVLGVAWIQLGLDPGYNRFQPERFWLIVFSTPASLSHTNRLYGRLRPKRFLLRIPQFKIPNTILPVKMSAGRRPISRCSPVEPLVVFGVAK
jgi:hypothetical protein